MIAPPKDSRDATVPFAPPALIFCAEEFHIISALTVRRMYIIITFIICETRGRFANSGRRQQDADFPKVLLKSSER